jgi:hypothetical protein
MWAVELDSSGSMSIEKRVTPSEGSRFYDPDDDRHAKFTVGLARATVRSGRRRRRRVGDRFGDQLGGRTRSQAVVAVVEAHVVDAIDIACSGQLSP